MLGWCFGCVGVVFWKRFWCVLGGLFLCIWGDAFGTWREWSIVWWCSGVIVLVLRYCFCCCWRGWVLFYSAVLLGGGLELLVSNAFGLWFGLMGKMVSGAEWS